MIVGNPIIMILKAILNWFRLRRDYIANAVDKIPPEIKDALVAWYNPCKQKLTNYDVIESYVEDFTKWAYRTERGTVTILNNKIIITDVILSSNIIEDSNQPYSDLTVYITGVTENKWLIVRQGRERPETHVKKDGLYTFKNNNLYFGFGVNQPGECNITITQLPTSILKDFSGNKHDAYLYGFKGKLNSSVGVYKIDFSKSQNASAFDNFERFNNKFIAKGNYNGNWNTFGEYDINGIVKNKVTIKITGLNNVKDKLALEYGYFTTDSKYIKTVTLIDKDGVYTYDLNDIVIPEESNIAYTIYNRMYFGESIINDINLIVEEIPDYPNQLCYDGKSYAITYGLPILTDYTIIADRTWFKDKVKTWSYFIDKNKAFVFERTSNGNNFSAKSFAAETSIKLEETNVSYQTKTSYNGNIINYHSDQSDNDDRLVIGSTKDLLGYQCFIGCHRDILLFNRTLTEYEISWVKNNLMCIEQQKPDKDDILKSLIVHYNVSKQGADNIKATNSLTDYSGNNRYATCKNFNWSNTEFVDDGKAMRLNGNGNCIVGINMPQLDKYTVIAKRRWIDKKSENKWFCSLGNGDYNSASQSLFWFDGGLLNNVFYTYNKGYKNPIVLPELISIQSSDDYNGVRINESNAVQVGNKLFIGSVGENDNTHVTADFYQLLLFDRVLTDKEREWVKENLIEPDTVSATKACTALFEPENLEELDDFPNGVIRDSLGGKYYLLLHSKDYIIQDGMIKSTDDTFLLSIEKAKEENVKAMLIDMYYDSTVPGSYLNGEYAEGSVKLTNRRIMGINNPTTTSIFQDLIQVLETGFTIGKIALYNRELTKDEFDSEAFAKGFAIRHSVFEKNASVHVFRDGHKELVPGEYLLPFETIYIRVDANENHTITDFVLDEVEQTWKPNTPKAYKCAEHDFHIIAMAEQLKVIKNWTALTSISTFNFEAIGNQIDFAGTTDGGTMKYILDDKITKFTIDYKNSAGTGTIHLVIKDKQYDVVSGQIQTYSVDGDVTLEFLNMEDVTNFAGTIKFSNVL